MIHNLTVAKTNPSFNVFNNEIEIQLTSNSIVVADEEEVVLPNCYYKFVSYDQIQLMKAGNFVGK